MHYRDILVYAGRAEGLGNELSAAMKLAMRDHAQVTTLHLETPARVPNYLVSSLGDEALTKLRDTAKADTSTIRAKAEAEAKARGVDLEFIAIPGDPAEQIESLGRYADLVVMSHGDGEDRSLVHEVVLHLGRPVLFVPATGAVESIGERVLIAWDGGREAARAVGDALPLLERAKAVAALTVAPSGQTRPTGGQQLAAHLARHGIACEAAVDYDGELKPADIILSRAADMGADLIVMGAYGHSRLAEALFGGVTRHVFQHMTLPTLMAH